MLKRCFDPVVNQDTRLLILGSLPGDKSLAAQEYYANPQNRFWELVGAVAAIDLRAMDYASRLIALQEKGIGLWDVVAQADRPGSLDTAIRNASHNSLAVKVDSLPALRAVAFNGGTAARLGRKQLDAQGPVLIDLPSSSPAHTIAFEKKLASWRQLAAFL